ncbi:MAG: bifunctional (p)ppGpp synthetase/guanosine-3',5'-bis(diphosphate) 3'-pyrophosphohydrolase [Alphaproteobacteria bacterium]|nr:bifunctional (p)ppGpp synthetase/guanosine-3',5'-bis(diphosphate) 3'-pyrophosphohydrolase [Alphaproteobacteria bacterium]
MLTAQDIYNKVKATYPHADCELIIKAYDFSQKAHETQKRASGEPYFLHPVAVAGILADLRLDPYSVITGLLHDTVEDTDVTPQDIEHEFGPEILQLVTGVTKLTRIEEQPENTQQAENFKKLLLALSTDIRVLLVKLADRLHNMRTLHHIQNPQKRMRIARESLDIYSSLADRIGLHKMKEEMDDIAFKELHPYVYESIRQRLNYLETQSGNLSDDVICMLHEKMSAHGIYTEISGREKSPYSIWCKMQRKNVKFEQLADIMAFRLVVGTLSECYQALGIIHQEFSVLPGRFKDYISTPKPNGYQSIHTVVLGPLNQCIEIQIRTKKMQEFAEFGVAAHWQYKEENVDHGMQHDGKQYAWVRSLLDILETTDEPEEFLENTKLEMFHDQVFCFTPKGKLVPLPRGATTVDFAYAIHSDLGNKTIGAKVNGRPVPLRTILYNGDQVEIITDKNHNPSPTWERFVITGKARAAVRRYIRSTHRQEFQHLGQALIQKAFAKDGVLFCEKVLKQVCTHLKIEHIDDLFVAVGEGKLTVRSILNVAYPPSQHHKTVEDELEHIKKHHPHKAAMAIQGIIPGMALNYAGCCHPIPGDKIIGIVTTGKGITIHKKDCESGTYKVDQDRILDLMWDEAFNSDDRYVVRIKIMLMNTEGALSKATAVLSKEGSNIVNLQVQSRQEDFWEMIIDLEVRHLTHLSHVVAGLRALSVVSNVERC